MLGVASTHRWRLADAVPLGNVGWVDNAEYVFDIEFTSTNVQVSVDGVAQFNINGTFEDGSFGFYNFSQPSVLYAGVTESFDDPPVADADGPYEAFKWRGHCVGWHRLV